MLVLSSRPSLNHWWITHEGRHYDAESPEGVASPLELPFYRRGMARTLQEEAPERFAELLREHAWWRESLAMARAVESTPKPVLP